MNTLESGINPTPEWTHQERIEIATSIASKLRDKAGEDSVDRGIVYDAAERIATVLNEPSAFLESHRKSILEGQTPANPPIKA